MTENQKLREAFETYITDGGKWPNAILKAPGGQYLLLRTSVAWQDWKACAEALALPTALAISDTWGISRALVTLYAYECDGATDKALALITADHIPDAWEMVADHLPNAGKMIETAAPVGEREAFEAWLGITPCGAAHDFGWAAWQARAALSTQQSPFECTRSHPHEMMSPECALRTEIARLTNENARLKATPALSAGDAVDAQRLDFIEKSARCDPKMDGQHVWWPTSLNKALKGPTLRDAIDAAMRKGQI